MPESENISVAKIAATPTSTSWSQAYNAGKLFAVISLVKEEVEEGKDFLNFLGKDVIETLEQEFFSLETKDLSSVKKAFEETLKKIPEGVSASFAIASIVENIIYLIYKNGARISLKRGEEFGILADSKDEEISAVSGIIKNDDILILQTKEFKEVAPSDVLISSLDNQSPNEVAETLAPLIHKGENGGASAIIIKYKAEEEAEEKDEIVPEKKEIEKKEEVKDEPQEQASSENKSNPVVIFGSLKGLIKIPRLGQITHSRKLILTIAGAIAILFIVIIVVTINNQNDAKTKALFESVYGRADEKYKEGEALAALNKNLATENFNDALKILNENKDKFGKNSKEEKQINELLEKITNEIDKNSPEKIAQNKDRSKISIIVQNGSGVEGTAGKAADFLKGKGYVISSTANADNYNYEGVTIKVKESSYIELLKNDLSSEYTVKNTSSDLASDSQSDAIIIIGK